MIQSFRCKETSRIFGGSRSSKFPPDIQERALAKLMLLHRITSLDQLIDPPSNRFHALKGERRGQYAIRINDQWRLTFRWQDGPAQVAIEDYH